MRKTLLIFPAALASLVLWAPVRLQANATPMLPHGSGKGEISAVDTTNHTFTLSEKDRKLSMSYDGKTQFVESGRTVQPSEMTTGEHAKVQFVEHDGKPWATKVDLHPVHHAKTESSKSAGKS